MTDDERPFLHQLNNKIAILDGRINILIKKTQQPETDEFTMTDVNQRLLKISKTLHEIEFLTKTRRDYLIEIGEDFE